METIILILHYLSCVILIITVLLQAGKGADMGVAFGGTSQTVFGSRGAATFLSKLTAVVAIVFLITSISLASISRNKSASSIIKTGDGQGLSLPIPKTESQPETQPGSESAPSETRPSESQPVETQVAPEGADAK